MRIRIFAAIALAIAAIQPVAGATDTVTGFTTSTELLLDPSISPLGSLAPGRQYNVSFVFSKPSLKTLAGHWDHTVIGEYIDGNPFGFEFSDEYYILIDSKELKSGHYSFTTRIGDPLFWPGVEDHTTFHIIEDQKPFLLSSFQQESGVYYRVTVSESVPEIATWAMLVLGLGFVGGLMRRKRAMLTTVSSYDG